MSSRNFRRVCGDSEPPPAEDDSSDAYEPLYAQNTSEASMYSGLVLSSESERESPVASEEEEEPVVNVQPQPKKKKSKKKRGKGKASHTKADENMDEIDKSVMEVNALLGKLPAASTSTETPTISTAPDHMKLSRMHLNVNVELKRFFGIKSSETGRRQRNEIFLMLKRILVMPINDTLIYEFKKKKAGLSMSICRCEGDIIYFTFDHSPERQKLHRNYLKLAKQRDASAAMNLEETRNSMHVEGLLELSEALFRLEEYSSANEIIENVIVFMQYCAHPSFYVASSNVRLEYSYWENRPFHVAILKFIYLLTNKACHRTALELAKMLLSLDPSDPLAVLFVIDSLALRAREHEWLVGAINNFTKQRQAGLLFNMQYSLALAEFHVATKKKRDVSEADNLLQEAILAYPTVVINILEMANITDPAILTHELFAREPDSFATDGLNVLMFVYAKLTYSRFREPAVLAWFRRNVTTVAENFTNNEDVKSRAKDLIRLRHGLFTAWPAEVMRHLGILKHMAPLIFESRLPRYDRQTCGWDPLQDGGVNRYNYQTLITPPFNMGPAGSTVYRFFSSMLPSYNVNDPPVDNDYYPDADGPYRMTNFTRTANNAPRIDGQRPEDIINNILAMFQEMNARRHM